MASLRVVSFSILVLALAKPSHAQQAAITKGEVYQPAKSSNAYVTIEGPGALRLYAAMKAKPIRDACRDNGSTIKTAGNLSCSMAAGGKAAICDFGLDTKTGKSSPQKPC